MGNKCTCFNDLFNNNNECNLAHKMPEKIMLNQEMPNDNNDLQSYEISNYDKNQTNKISKNRISNMTNSNNLNNELVQRSNINININNINKIINNYENNINNSKSPILKSNNIQNNNNINNKYSLIIGFMRGYILRKKYKTYLKNELIEQGQNLLEEYLKITKNEKVSQIIDSNNDPIISSYLSANWDEFYSEDPTKEINHKINLTKKYSKGLIFKYRNNNYLSMDTKSSLGLIKYCYIGEVNLLNNKKCGKGEIIYSNGAREKGTYYNNEFIGWNQFIDDQGVLYIGLFNNGLNGKGLRYNKEINHIYKGDFYNGLRNGKGKDERDSAKYEGEFKNDKKCGKGKIVFDSGDTYVGEFSDNKFNGYGHYIWFKNGHEYKGYYLNGKFHGQGFYKWGKNEYYKGEYVNGVKEGKGEISFADGKKFFVNFTNGKPNGIGIFQDQDGNKCEVEFINGKINKKYKKK